MFVIYGSSGSLSIELNKEKEIFITFQDRTKEVQNKEGKTVHPVSSMMLSPSDCYAITNSINNQKQVILSRDIPKESIKIRKLLSIKKNETKDSYFVSYNVSGDKEPGFVCNLAVDMQTSQVLVRCLMIAVDTAIKSKLGIE